MWLRERLGDGEAGELLDELTGCPLPSDLREPVLELLQGHPLALTWAGKLMARGDEDPRWLLREWRGVQLPPLADPTEGRHTLAWPARRTSAAGRRAQRELPRLLWGGGSLTWRNMRMYIQCAC